MGLISDNVITVIYNGLRTFEPNKDINHTLSLDVWCVKMTETLLHINSCLNKALRCVAHPSLWMNRGVALIQEMLCDRSGKWESSSCKHLLFLICLPRGRFGEIWSDISNDYQRQMKVIQIPPFYLVVHAQSLFVFSEYSISIFVSNLWSSWKRYSCSWWLFINEEH